MARTWMKVVGIAVVGLVVVGVGIASQPQLLLDVVVRLERARAGLTQDSVGVDGHEIVYLRGGKGPVLVLVHGFAADSSNWVRIAPHLSGFDLVVPDLPGHGESSRDIDARYDIASQVERLKGFHDALDLGAMHLAGNSMGGHISAAYTVRYPEDVAKLVLIDSGGVTSPQKSELTLALEQGVNPLLVTDVQDFDRLLAFVFVDPPWIPGPVKRHLAEQAVEHRPFNDKIFRDLGQPRLPLEPVLSQILAPTLNLWGEQDRVIDPSAAAVFQAGIPNCRTETMPKTGHSPMIERPEAVAELMREFFAEP